MDDPFDRGLPFELSQLWAQSAFTYSSADNFLLDTLDLDGSLLELDERDNKQPGDESFTIPDLGEINPIGFEFDEPDPATSLTPPQEGADVDDVNEPTVLPDIWDFDRLEERKGSLLQTWESFDRRSSSANANLCLLSEAGTGAFDAAVAISPHGKNCQGVVPQDVLLRAYCTLVLGRSSVFFHWDENKHAFVHTLTNVPMSGLSPACSGSIAVQFLRHGSLVRQLYDYSARQASKRKVTAAETAFKRSVTSILDGLEAGLSSQIFRCTSVLQLQDVMSTPRELVETIKELADAIKGSKTDEEAISALSNHVQAVVEAGSDIAALLRILLSRVCAPWLERLAGDLGLTHSSDNQHAENDEDEPQIENQQGDVHQVNHGQLSFVDPEDKKRIEETKASLKILRKHLRGEVSSDPHMPYDTSSIASILPAWSSNSVSMLDGNEKTYSTDYLGSKPSQGLWNLNVDHDQYLETLEAQISHQPESSHLLSDQELHSTAIRSTSLDNKLGDGSANPDYTVAFNPLDELRPLIQTQALRLNGILLRYIFRSCNFKKHLELQREFQLFGNSDFITRFSTALFSSEAQTARRTRGNVPTSEIMGLRLSAKEDQRWPPASSELRLALADVLSDAYRRRHAIRDQDKVELPGGLGFTIRELPDEEIERTMDPGSIYALDFLKLEYAAPPPLDAILTTASLRKYDEVFRFMLKMIRSQYTVTRLRNASSSPDHGHGLVAHFPIEAHHIVSTLMTYFMDVGIDAPWSALMGRFDALEKTLIKEDSSGGSEKPAGVGINYLRETHDACLETIRERLFLKKKQQKIRDSVEEVLSSILHAAAVMGTREAAQGISSFRRAASSLVKLLQATADRPPKRYNLGEWMEMEIEPVKLLLSNLNWNQYY